MLRAFFDEIAGSDPATRRAAASPYTLSVAFYAAGEQALGGQKWQDAPGPLGI